MGKVLLRYGVMAALVAAAGFGLWRAGQLEQRAAEAHRELLTLQFDTPVGEYDAITEDMQYVGALPGFATIGDGVREQRATANYWRNHYDELALKTSATGEILERDPKLLLLAANAAYRGAAIDESSPAAVQRMEGLLNQYGDVLRKGEWQFDAAYNYEFVARRRDALIRSRGARGNKEATKRADGSRPIPSTLHGRLGAVPPGNDMSEFKIVVPQRSDERREQPEAGKGGPKSRKG
ncbi:MAG: hypothetical protein AB7N65_09620 [Vicinamibacterales bacterium]